LHTNSTSKYAAVYYIEGTPKGYDNRTMIIPNGVDATSGQELTFSAKTIRAPPGIKVFL
jgi:hypothetical protein